MGNTVTKTSVKRQDPLFDHATPPSILVEWKSIKSVCDDAKYYDNIPCACDIKQGRIGNCYYVAALYSLILFYTISRPDLISILFHIISPWQSFDEPMYSGLFEFNLWNGFAWERVVVDDRLPFDLYHPSTLISSNTQSKEYWPVLLEKAILKFTNTSFSSVDKGGLPADILKLLLPTRLTSAIITNPTEQTIRRYLTNSNAFCTAAILTDLKTDGAERVYNMANHRRRELVLENNLATYHAFTVFPHNNSDEVALVLNPWQRADFVRQITNEQHAAHCELCRALATVENRDDGRWLMSVNDVASEFNALYVSQLNVTDLMSASDPAQLIRVHQISGGVERFGVFVHFVNEMSNDVELKNSRQLTCEFFEESEEEFLLSYEFYLSKQSSVIYFSMIHKNNRARYIKMNSDSLFISYCVILK